MKSIGLFFAVAIGAIYCTNFFNLTSADSPNETEETYKYDSDPDKLLDTFAKYVYANNEAFLREILSNCSDALNKVRLLSLTDPNVLAKKPELDIQVIGDEESNRITIIDSGIGMTKEELIKNLGTISKSGTADFDKTIANDKSIGQFGIGFYSVFSVADKVTVVSRGLTGDQNIWTSFKEGKFTVKPDTTGEDLVRGTKVILDLKKENGGLSKQSSLEDLIKKYSSFIEFPISLWKAKTVNVDVPLNEEEIAQQETEKAKEIADAKAKNEELKAKKELKEAEEAKKKEEKEAKKANGEEVSADAEEEEDEDEDEEINIEEIEKKPLETTKKEEQTVKEFVVLNIHKPIWLQDPKTLVDSDYKNFFKISTKEKDDPITYIHSKVEGDVSFQVLMYLPVKPATNPLDPTDSKKKKSKISLYTRRVLISDEIQDLLPEYLSFVTGIVDSEDLPLNISRESIQNAKHLIAPIKKHLTNKILGMLKDLAAKEPEKYKKFWNAYAVYIKLGIKDDEKNREKLAKLARFKSSFVKPKTAEEDVKKESEEPKDFDLSGEDSGKSSLISLSDYVGRAKNKQTTIFFSCGPSVNEILKSPHVEAALSRGYEILLFDDPYDQYVAKTIGEFEGLKFQDVGEHDVNFGDETEEEKKELENLKETFQPLSDWWVKLLEADIDSVNISKKLTKSPCAVTSKGFGVSGYMLKVMNAQAGSKENPYLGFLNTMKKTLEINPKHPAIVALNERVKSDTIDEDIKAMAKLMYEAALISSGYDLKDYSSMIKTVDQVIRKALNVDPLAVPEVNLRAAEDKKPAEHVENSQEQQQPEGGASSEVPTDLLGENFDQMEDVNLDAASPSSRDEL